jgi:hypothetical protein
VRAFNTSIRRPDNVSSADERLVELLTDKDRQTEPWMPPIQNLAKAGPVGVIKLRCTTARAHLSLNMDAPISRAAEAAERVISHPILGGLHHARI